MVKAMEFTGSEIIAPYNDINKDPTQIRADDIAGALTPSKTLMDKAGVYDGGGAFDRLRDAGAPVPPGVDGMRLKRHDVDGFDVEILAGDQVVETLRPENEKAYGARLDVISESLDERRFRKFRKAVRRVSRESNVLVDRHEAYIELERRNQVRSDELLKFNLSHGGKLVLQKPTTSKTQAVLDCVASGDLSGSREDLERFRKLFDEDPPIPFLVEHDWRAAFSKAEQFEAVDDDVKLPFDFCMFEFRVSGHHICIYRTEGGVVGWFVEVRSGWVFGDVSEIVTHWRARHDELHLLLHGQIRAVCIALDAEVAERETVRAPEKLQRSRIKRGKKPLSDYHVVRLTRRTRAAPLESDGEPTGRHTRLHFVRGHWRHFENHKTWIAWHLRGDPDLGFIDKHYRF